MEWLIEHWVDALAVIGTIGTLTALVWALYSHYSSKRTRAPRIFEVHPRGFLFRSTIMDGADLRVMKADGTLITKDVISVQFCFVNAGRETIRATDVVKPIRVEISDPQSEIVSEPRVLAESVPEVNGFRIRNVDKRTVEINFHLADYRQGALFHLAYTGDPSTELVVGGYIAGAKLEHIYEPKARERLRDEYGGVFTVVTNSVGGVIVLAMSTVPQLVMGRQPSYGLATLGVFWFLMGLSLVLIRKIQRSNVPSGFYLPPTRGGVK